MLDEIEAALDELAELDPATLSDRDSIVRLHRIRSRVEAVEARATAAFDAAGEWQTDGARTAAAWLTAVCRMPTPAAKRRVRLGRALRHMPAAEQGWLAGRIEADHVALLARARTAKTAEVFARDEAVLVGNAEKLPFRAFQRAVAYWCQLADPDGADRDADNQQGRRRLHNSQTIGGMWMGDWLLDPISGAIVDAALRHIEREFFEADWAGAKQKLGRDPKPDELGRTPAQRRADALVELAIRAHTAPKNGKRPEPLLSVLVGYETFAGRICELADGTVVAPGALLSWLTAAWVERVVFDGPSRVVDVGVRRRLFGGATRRAVQLRDRECYHPYCDEPAERCQIDHIQPWPDGGPTTQHNGRAACGFHNRLRNQQPAETDDGTNQHEPRPPPDN